MPSSVAVIGESSARSSTYCEQMAKIGRSGIAGSYGRGSGAEGGAALGAPHHPQARPRVVDRADLVVHQAEREGYLADVVLGEVGGHAAGPLRPRDPEAAVDVERLDQRRE